MWCLVLAWAVLAEPPANVLADPSFGVARAEPGSKTMVEIGSRPQLFVDSFLLDALSGEARRVLHSPTPREVVLTFDRPWEGSLCAYVTVMRVESGWRLYYRGLGSEEDGRQCTCVAESTDGVQFTRPSLGLFESHGSKDNNIVWQDDGSHNFTPFLDSNPAAPADQRYKAFGSIGPHSKLGAFGSPDGLHWRLLQAEPVLTDGDFDSQNLGFFDPLRGEYVAYYRAGRDGVRDVKVARSKDFIHWSPGQWLDYQGAGPEHLYTNAIAPYPRAPELYLGFPCRFVPERTKFPEHKAAGVNDGVLMSSRDGLHFERWREAFLRPGLDPDCWTERNNYLAWGLAETSPSEISLYWNEHYRHPGHQLRRGVIRTDGFVSVNAGFAGGELLTRPLVFAGKRLVINYSTSAVGSVRAELCDEHGTPYPGFDCASCALLFGDEIAAELKWGERSPGELAGKPVRLRVRLKDADLFSFRLVD
ncbi:MAG: hypothetical protein HYU66_06880 [Armatimonadetes bacterium]|nr:hypothetical protein [Armatimonadota bacterium]